jgi:hypothetical protein
MLPEDQAEVIEFLVAPSAHGNATVARIDTHSAIVSSRASALTRLVYHKGDR